MLQVIIWYLIGCVIAYIVIGRQNDKHPEDTIKFPWVFSSWFIVLISLLFIISDIKLPPPTLKRKKKL